ncbi:hypothetical protein [Streptomyces viridosporus]|uniref:hypothetical protein n=1 Tax=Streptomyces viridosporus TaxID=67581 RepID=UPI0036F8AE8E
MTSASPRRLQARAVPYPVPVGTRVREPSPSIACRYTVASRVGGGEDGAGHLPYGTTVPGST